MVNACYESLAAYAAAFIDDFAERCNACGDCLDACPMFPYSVFRDDDTGEARTKILDFIRNGSNAEQVSEFVRSCYFCHECIEACPQGLNPYWLNDLIRPLLKNRGLLPDGYPHDGPYIFLPDTKYNFMKTLAAIQTRLSEKRWLTALPVDPPQADVVFFPSCGEVAFPDRLFTKIDLLEKMGIDFVTIGPYENEACCGVVQILAGSYERAEAVVRRLIDMVEMFNPQTVIVGCPGTYRWIRDIAPHFRPYSFRFQHYFSFLSDHIDRLELSPVPMKVTVHDACKLSRGGVDESECPRRILNAIPGIEIVEMEHTRDKTICCGEDLPHHLSELAKKVQQQRLKEAVDCGAEVLTTVCPACDHNLSRESAAYPITIRNVLSVLSESADIQQYENKIDRFRSYNDIDRVIQECRDTIIENGFTPEEIREPLSYYL